MPAGNHYRNQALDSCLGSSRSSRFPTSLYLALYRTRTTNVGGGVEMSGSGYSRLLVPNNTVSWPDASGFAKKNAKAFVFPTATANWPLIGWWALKDAALEGRHVFHGEFVNHRRVPQGTTFRIPVGGLVITAE